MKNVRFLLSSNPVNLETALKGKRSATVEAEYGAVTIQGSVLTLAHHGVNAGNPAPCSYDNGIGDDVDVVGLSHFDLDTLGGCAAILGVKPEAETFWKLAEFIDLNGAHKLQKGIEKAGATEADVAKLFAYWAWSKNFRVFQNRDGSVSDVTAKVTEGCEVLRMILGGNEEILAAGEAFKLGEQKLNEESFVDGSGGVLVRVGPQFVNHLYVDPWGNPHEAVVAFNTIHGSITVSFAEKPIGDVNAETIVKKLWGHLASGHAAIAGSPRGERMSIHDINDAAEEVVELLSEIERFNEAEMLDLVK